MSDEQHVPEMKFDMVSPNNIMLKTKLDNFDFDNPPTDPIQLSKDLVDTMMAQQGLGLSANQCGLPYKVFVMRGQPFYACFNPRIVSFSDETIDLDEGCLSYPGLWVKVRRPKQIRCRFQMPNGDIDTKTFDGMTARIFQHELDHLNGKNFVMRANRMHRERAMKKWKQIQRKN